MSDYEPHDSNKKLKRILMLYNEFDRDDAIMLELLCDLDYSQDKWIHHKIDWDYHLSKKFHEQSFERTYRMTYDSFQVTTIVVPIYVQMLLKEQSRKTNSTPQCSCYRY